MTKGLTFFCYCRKVKLLRKVAYIIFSNTFVEVQQKSDQIWKYKRYGLVNEYYNRPGLVAPFMILEHIWLLMRYMYRTFCEKTESRNELRNEQTELRNELSKSNKFL